jgi:hypothetical protein
MTLNDLRKHRPELNGIIDRLEPLIEPR